MSSIIPQACQMDCLFPGVVVAVLVEGRNGESWCICFRDWWIGGRGGGCGDGCTAEGQKMRRLAERYGYLNSGGGGTVGMKRTDRMFKVRVGSFSSSGDDGRVKLAT